MGVHIFVSIRQYGKQVLQVSEVIANFNRMGCIPGIQPPRTELKGRKSPEVRNWHNKAAKHRPVVGRAVDSLR